MNRLIPAFLLLVVFTAQAAEDWRETLTNPSPGAFPEAKNFRAKFSFGWSDLFEAAEAQADFKREGGRIRVEVKGRTLGLARALWRLDAEHNAVIEAGTFRPVELRQVEKYRNRSIETKVRFAPGRISRFRQVSIDPPDKASWKNLSVPAAFDIVGGLLFVRSQPLNDDDKVRLIVYPGESPYLVEVTVEGREKITAMGQPRDAIRLGLSIRKIETDKGKLTQPVAYQKFRGGSVWVSDDAERLPLRAEVSVFVGFIYGDLISVETP